MKKIIVIALMFAMLVTMTACGFDKVSTIQVTNDSWGSYTQATYVNGQLVERITIENMTTENATH